MRGMCVHEKEDLTRPGWDDDEIHFGEEQASFRVSVHEIRGEHTKFTANTQVLKKVTQQSHSIRDITLELLQQSLVFSQQDQFPPTRLKALFGDLVRLLSCFPIRMLSTM
jgi:hypothetical protein